MKIGKLQIDEIELASQGNAVLGIRDSGKTYTATWIAERLLDAGIPFIAFDPIGVWRYLRIGKADNKGYQVVVAGDGGDLPLTAENAPNIVRAAMRENIPLVLDLYSMNLSKSQWKQIVEQSVKLLIYENKSHGLRHVFIEEAAEFVPQRVRPDEGRVYAAMEQLARMGRNSSLGYTLINQRAEEVNKAVLELCDGLFLHRQKGRNSLNALSKWLDIADASNGREIIKSLPTLPQGECWYWPQGSRDPLLIKIPEKTTVHPDPKNPEKISARAASVDVSDFISRLNESLAQQEKSKLIKKTFRQSPIDRIIEPARFEDNEITILKQECDRLRLELSQSKARESESIRRLQAVQEVLRPQYEMMSKLFSELGANDNQSISSNGSYSIWLEKLQGKQRDMLSFLIEKKRVTKTQLGLLIGMSASGGSFNTYLSKIRTLKLARMEGEYIVLNEIE